MSEIDWSKAPHWADRVVRSPRQRQLFWADDNSRQYFIIGQRRQDKQHIRDNWEVVERRPDVPKYCESVMRQMPGVTIEQRLASLRALEKQVEETRAELTRDVEALGLTWMVQGEPYQPIITDWRDLRVGDVIWIGESPNAPNAPSGEYSITATDFNDRAQPVQFEWSGGKTWPDFTNREWRFIRRP